MSAETILQADRDGVLILEMRRPKMSWHRAAELRLLAKLRAEAKLPSPLA